MQPLTKLLALFVAWKALLVAIALLSPTPAYDTSTEFLFQHEPPMLLRRLATGLTRWDSIYFVTSAHRGHVLEQEWAFSRFVATVTNHLASVISGWFGEPTPSILTVALTGIALAHVSHLVAVFLLFGFIVDTLPTDRTRAVRVAFTTACLHIFSPGGIFLSSLNAESLFAAVTFSGVWRYAWSVSPDATSGSMVFEPTGLLMSSVWFGVASLIRGNGLLNGVIFLWDLLGSLPRVPALLSRADYRGLWAVCAIGLSGLALGSIYALGQLDPYLEYCTNGHTRPWCDSWLPSIYTFVQRHYWNNGFLRYWTLSNLPLFLLAAPMLVLLASTAWVALRDPQALVQLAQASQPRAALLRQLQADSHHTLSDRAAEGFLRMKEARFRHVLARVALPQLILAALNLTSFHVQIINRISSGSPLWYVVLAIAIHGAERGEESSGAKSKRPKSEKSQSKILRVLTGPKTSRGIVRGMIMYAIIQGGLYACFLPPA